MFSEDGLGSGEFRSFSSLDCVTGEIYEDEVGSEIGQCAQYGFNAFRLRDRIADVAADDDASVRRHLAMQADEVQSVVGQDCAFCGGRRGKDLLIGQTTPGEAGHCECEDSRARAHASAWRCGDRSLRRRGRAPSGGGIPGDEEVDLLSVFAVVRPRGGEMLSGCLHGGSKGIEFDVVVSLLAPKLRSLGARLAKAAVGGWMSKAS